MKFSKSSLALRAAIALIVLASAYLLYEKYSRPQQRQSIFRRLPNIVAWEAERRPFYDSLSFVNFDDQQSIATAINSQIAKSRVFSEKLTSLQASEAAKVIEKIFYAMGASSPNEYLRRIVDIRKLKAAPQEDAALQWNYKAFTGKTMPSEMSSAQLLEVFWQGLPNIQARPVRCSLNDQRGVMFSLKEFDGKRIKIIQVDWNGDEARIWENPASTGMVGVTESFESSDDIARSFGKVLILSVDTVVGRVGGKNVPLHISLFWSPVTNSWNPEFVSIQTDERFFWPV